MTFEEFYAEKKWTIVRDVVVEGLDVALASSWSLAWSLDLSWSLALLGLRGRVDD